MKLQTLNYQMQVHGRRTAGMQTSCQECACADGIPIVLRVWKHKNFEPGPFKLGAWQLPVNLTAIAWIIMSTVRRFRTPFHLSKHVFL